MTASDDHDASDRSGSPATVSVGRGRAAGSRYSWLLFIGMVLVATALAMTTTSTGAQRAAAIAVIVCGVVLSAAVAAGVRRTLGSLGQLKSPPMWWTVVTGVLVVAVARLIQQVGPVRGGLGAFAAALAAAAVLLVPVGLAVQWWMTDRSRRRDAGSATSHGGQVSPADPAGSGPPFSEPPTHRP